MPLNRILQFLPAASLALAAAISPQAAEFRAAFQPVDPALWRQHGEHTIVELAGPQPAVAIFTVPAGGAGFYAITDSHFQRDSARPGRIELGLWVSHAGARPEQQPPPAVLTVLEAGELFDFDAFLGYLAEGDTVKISVGAADDGATGDGAGLDCRITRVPAIPVTVFPDDFAGSEAVNPPGEWTLLNRVEVDSPAARVRAWRPRPADLPPGREQIRVQLEPAGLGASVAAFRVPHSGYYALHEAWARAPGQAAEVRIYVGAEAGPRRALRLEPSSARVSLDTDLGYLAKGEVIHLAFASGSASAESAVDFGGSIVEWAPRRAPLRVRRGNDGLLDVFEPEAPRLAVDIPAAHWITVPARSGDATAAIRDALEQARRRFHGESYAGVRLETGQTYTVASNQTGGTVFGLLEAQRIVFDGNGATLRVASPELTHTEVDLFSVAASRNIVFADFIVTATSIPFTTGEVLDVSPRGEMTQTVTFRVDPGELDPLKDISRDGRNNAYAYDPRIPGRLAVNSWTHYPGSGSPSIRATGTPGVFTHRVTRTNDSIEPGAKWLIKNKRGGVIYLTTRSGTENVTLSGIDGRAAGGGQLRFWQTSGVNILDSRFEPDGDNWISSSADGIHGRGREGVWIENTLIRGICEDVMNTYGQNMVAVPDDDPDDAIMSIRMFERSLEATSGRGVRMPAEENVTTGDQLVFFNPQTGRVLGHAGVVSIRDGRFTLTNPVPGVDAWEEADGRNATMVYNTRVAGRFFVRDTRFMDGMRIGIYIKARGGVIFGSQFEGLSAPAILGMNEPEWPEGPPPTHLWVQGCTFSQNNYGYMPRNRDYVVVDPADISVYTRHFRDPAVPDDFRAFVTRGQYANSHVKLLGNVFHDWRGMGIAVRNSRNVRIADNLFLPPVNDEVMRRTLADDPVFNAGGRGTYAAIFLDSVGGAQVGGNRFHGLPAGDRTILPDRDVAGLLESDNVATAAGATEPLVSLSFDEWFGASSSETAAIGRAQDKVGLGGAQHRAGRLGAGLHFNGGAPATLAASADTGGSAATQFGVALWACPEKPNAAPQVVYAQGDARQGLVIALDGGRWRAGLWRDNQGAWLDLGSAVGGLWQHVALVCDGTLLRGYLDGTEIASSPVGPALAAGPPAERAPAASFGGVIGSTRIGAQRELSANSAAFSGGLDEFRAVRGVWSADDVAALALRRPESLR